MFGWFDILEFSSDIVKIYAVLPLYSEMADDYTMTNANFLPSELFQNL
jgi:hypothetical protein